MLFPHLRYQIMASKSWLPNPCFHILATRSWLPDPGFRSWLPDPGHHILASTSWLPHPGFHILVSISWLPDPGLHILASTSWLPDPADLRRELAHFVASNPALQLRGNALADWVWWERRQTPQRYAAKQGEAGHGGAMELALYAHTRNVAVHVYEPCVGGGYLRIARFDSVTAERTLHLLFAGGNHYDVLTPAEPPAVASSPKAAPALPPGPAATASSTALPAPAPSVEPASEAPSTAAAAGTEAKTGVEPGGDSAAAATGTADAGAVTEIGVEPGGDSVAAAHNAAAGAVTETGVVKGGDSTAALGVAEAAEKPAFENTRQLLAAQRAKEDADCLEHVTQRKSPRRVAHFLYI